MIEKEERIEQFITIQQRTITTRDYEVNDEIISRDYPRQEVIKRIAKALCRMATNGECRYSCDTCDFKAQEKVIAEIFPQLEDSFTEQAKTVLNALLEGGKDGK